VDFDPGASTALLSTAGATDGYVVKLSSSGNYVWAKGIGGVGPDIATGSAVDSSGNVYVTGNFSGTVDFDPGAAVQNLSSAGGTDAFVLKLSSSGDYVWAKSVGGTGNDSGSRLALDSSGNVHIVGFFNSTSDFDPGAGVQNLSSAGGADAFVLKLSSSGDYVWAKSVGGTESDSVNMVALDSSGNVHATGRFTGTVDFDPGAGTQNLVSTVSTPVTSDVFVWKLSSSGDYVWAKSVGGAGGDSGSGVALDSSGNVYITGYFFFTADFDPGAATQDLTSLGNDDVFVLKLSSSGDYLWVKSVGGTGSEWGNSVALDSSGNVHVAGRFSNTVDFDPSAGVQSLASAGATDAFVLKLSSSGSYVWAKSIGGTGGDAGNTVALDSSGNVHIAGDFISTVDFDTSDGTANLTATCIAPGCTVSGGQDGFVLRLDATGNSATSSAPTPFAIDSITSSVTNGSYRSGNIDIVVTFNQATTIAVGQPNPALLLNSGQNVQATYLSSNGDNTQHTFRYAVASPQNTPPNTRLHVMAIQNSASLVVGGQPAPLAVLPAFGAAGSLSANKELYVDTIAPVIFGASPPPGLPIAPIVARTASFSVFLDGGERLVFVPGKKVQIRTVALPDANVEEFTIPAAGATITTARTGTTVTATKNSHGYTTGDLVSISGVATPSMNGTFAITVVDANSFTYATPQSGNVASNAAGTAVKAPSGLSLVNGQLGINFTGDLLGPTAAVISATRTDSTVVYTTDAAHNFKAPLTPTAIARAGNVATITAANHGLIVGDQVTLAGATGTIAGLNGNYVVATRPDANTITVASTGGDIADPGSGYGALAYRVAVSGAGAIFNAPNCVVSAVTTVSPHTFTCTSAGIAGTQAFPLTATAGTQVETEYFIIVENGLLKDLAGNDLVGLTAAPPASQAWKIKTGVDRKKPRAVMTNRSDFFPPLSAFEIDFDESMVTSSGTPTLSPNPSSGITLTTGVTGNRGTITFGGTGLTSNTTYTLTVPLTTFTDTSENQIEGDASLIFTFSTNPAPVGGGGGASGPCGPPPLPPCGVGPGLNFGPGGMIQNPGAIGSGDMANLRPDNFMGFRPDDARNLGAGAMQNFRPDQFGALPPAAMAGFNRDQIANLNPAAMAGMNQTQFRALPPEAMGGFRPDQMAQLPPDAMGAFDRSRMQALPPSAMAGFNANQFAQLPPSAMAGFDPTRMQQLPPSAMAGFNANQMQQLPPTAMAVMNPNQLGQMPPAAFGAIQPQQFNVLPPTAMQGFKPELMAALPPQMMQNFKPAQFAQIPPSAMGGLNEDRFRALPPQAMTAFNPQQMGAVPPQALEAMRVAQFNVIPPTAMQGIKPDQFAALPPDAMQAFKPEQMRALPPSALAGMEPEQLRVLPPTAARALNPQQLTAVPPQALAAIPPGVFKALTPQAIAALTPEQRNAMPPQAFNPPPLPQPATAGNIANLVNSLSGWNIDKVPPAAFGGMRPNDVAKLPPDAFSAMNPNQVGALPPAAFTAMKPSQVELLSPEAMAAMKPTQFGLMPPSAMAALSPAQFGALPPAAMSQVKPTQLGQLPPEAFEMMKPTQMGQLPPAAFTAMKPTQLGSLPPEAMAGMKPTQVGALPPAAMAALDPSQVAALPPTALTQMKPTQVAALPAEALSEMKPTQVAALPAAAMSGLKPNQLAALPPEAMSTMKPTQVAALKPTAMAALEPAQVDALPAAAFRDVKPTQVGALPTNAVKALEPAQINAMPSVAFAGLKPEQAQQLTRDQAARMKGPDLAAMSPAVRAIVNNLKG